MNEEIVRKDGCSLVMFINIDGKFLCKILIS